MKPTILASLPVTAWLTIGWWCVLTSSAELVSVDVINTARCHVRCVSLTQVNMLFSPSFTYPMSVTGTVFFPFYFSCINQLSSA